MFLVGNFVYCENIRSFLNVSMKIAITVLIIAVLEECSLLKIYNPSSTNGFKDVCRNVLLAQWSLLEREHNGSVCVGRGGRLGLGGSLIDVEH